MLSRTLVFLLLVSSAPAFAEKKVSVAELGQRFAADLGQSDAEAAKHLGELRLKERLSAAALRRLEAYSPGPAASQELKILAEQSEFLSLPAAEIPLIPTPNLTAQKKMLGLVVTYVSKTLHQLPEFSTSRVTQEFIDGGLFVGGSFKRPYRPMHKLVTFQSTLKYRGGEELVTDGPSDNETAQQERSGLQEWEVFGAGLSTIFLDAVRSNLSWSHWERTEAGPRAVFRYAVPKRNSHYEVKYCCVPNANPEIILPLEPFHRLVGFHGEITVDPNTGTILRLTTMAALSPGASVSRADTMVEYGPIEIDGQSFISATRSVMISEAITYGIVSGSSIEPPVRSFGPPVTLIKDITFQQFHLLRADAGR